MRLFWCAMHQDKVLSWIVAHRGRRRSRFCRLQAALGFDPCLQAMGNRLSIREKGQDAARSASNDHFQTRRFESSLISLHFIEDWRYQNLQFYDA